MGMIVNDAFIDSCGFRARTLTTRDRLALLIPPSTSGAARDPHMQPSFVQVTETRPSLVEVPE